MEVLVPGDEVGGGVGVAKPPCPGVVGGVHVLVQGRHSGVIILLNTEL